MCLCLKSSCPYSSTLMAVPLFTWYSPAPQCRRCETLELPPRRFSAGVCPITTRQILKWSTPSFILPLEVTDNKGLQWERSWGGGAESHRSEQRTWACLSSSSISVWNWEYLLSQTSPTRHMKLCYVQLGHSGTLSDALYIFALTHLKGQSMKSMAMNMGQQKRNVFSLSTGTCCHRRLQKQMLWMDIKAWNV